MELLAAEPWTYWLAPVIFLVSIVTVLAFFVRYLMKVVGPKHPKQ